MNSGSDDGNQVDYGAAVTGTAAYFSFCKFMNKLRKDLRVRDSL
ncbi:hypothetical protein [Piscirickettsia salmonis]|nr:hypothetical protein [Piscirickettsia salmonis]